jgi:glycosyltransferase involved in cell wall biosynthesis
MRRQWRARLPIHVLHNGVDETPRTPSIGRRILVLSRLAPEKRIDLLLHAVARLRSDDTRWTMTVGGEGDLRQDLHSLAKALGVDEAVSFPGFIDARSALRDHDVLVQLSSWENCSYSLLDAVAAGVGVVASDVGGNSEFLPPQSLTTGAEAEVARRIEEQALSPDSRPHLPLGWPSIANMIDHIETVYEELQS